MYKTSLLFFLLNLVIVCSTIAQVDVITNSEHYYAIDNENKIILCHSTLIDEVHIKENEPTSITLQNYQYTFVEPLLKIEETKSYKVMSNADTISLYFTSLPIIKITSTQEIKDEPKSMAQMTYADSNATHKKFIAIELRGNSALKYPKKSYDLEIRAGENSEESNDLKFGNLREDDDWILNSLYNEPLKIRSYFSTKLWLELTNAEGSIKKINDVLFTEVFLNNRYQGVYILSEQVDRKQLKLKKLENGVAKGLLYKGNRLEEGTTFKSAPLYKNALPTWSGFEMKYPYENYDSHWEGIHQLVSLVSKTNKIFNAQIQQNLDIDNAIDYYLLVNLLRATDNVGKNYFIAREDESTPFYFIPWDLDGVLGNVTDGIRIDITNDILTNHLFDKLLVANPGNYRTKLKTRWNTLRSSHFSDESLFSKLEEIYSQFDKSKLYERDAIVWPDSPKANDDLKYLTTWLEKRLIYLDSYFSAIDE